MQAVILAAGFGSRLERVSDGMPKCLLQVGGRPLIEHQLEALHDAGIGRILVVVGHKADEVRKTLGNRVEYIENTRYDKTNSIYSLWLARDWVNGPMVLLNCDLLFHPDILDRLLSKGGNALAFDSTSTKGKEQTKVAVREGKVIDLGKDLAPELARGESLGLLSFDAAGVHSLFSRAHALVQNEGENSWVIEAVRSVCSDVDMRALNVAGSAWVEIDFPNDLERARKEVWPAIQSSHWKRTIYWRKTKYVVMALVTAALVSTGLVIGSYSGPEKVAWTYESPPGAERAILKVSKGHQRWWMSSREKPMSVVIDGPSQVRIDVRLLMPPGTAEPGRYVVEVALDGKPVTWQSFKATPDLDSSLPDWVVGDRDRVRLEIPEGGHSVEVGLLAGTSDRFLARIGYPEPVSPDGNLEENNE
ncbi:MAG: NTP transferase domain-containing protein [Thermodesulfobacteriota bacterium]